MRKSDNPTLVLVLGPRGSGKERFEKCYRNSFLQAFPILPLYQGVISGSSFCAISSLNDEKDISLIVRAKNKGYRIIAYTLFAARLLCAERNRIKGLIDGVKWEADGFRDEYESFYSNLLDVYSYLDMVFFVNNQKGFEFLGAYGIDDVPASAFEKALRKRKAASDKIRTS